MTLIPCKGTQKYIHLQICSNHISSPHGLSAPLDLEIANYPKRGGQFFNFVCAHERWVGFAHGGCLFFHVPP